MTDYISREKIKEEVQRLSSHWLNEWDSLGVLALIDRQPAADVVPKDFHERCLQIEIQKRMALEKADVREVVYCKDCKWYEINELKKDGTEDRRYKPSDCMLAEQRREPNHFCADGEKREEQT